MVCLGTLLKDTQHFTAIMKTGALLNSRRGFTLIELLVVVSIIALLAAILFPVFARARDNARRSACSSNMKQIGLGLMQYTQDWDEKLPVQAQPDSLGIANYAEYGITAGVKHNWIWAVQPYVKTWDIFWCPSMMQTTVYQPTGNSKCSYALNGVAQGRNLSVITTPAELIYLQEQSVGYHLARQLPYKDPNSSNYYAWFWSTASSYSHFEGGNLLFCDGHVKWRKLSGIAASEFGLVATTLVGPPPSPYNETATVRAVL